MLPPMRTRHGAAQVSSLGSASSWSECIVPRATHPHPELVTDSLQYQLRQNGEAVANSIVLEQGKTYAGSSS